MIKAIRLYYYLSLCPGIRLKSDWDAHNYYWTYVGHHHNKYILLSIIKKKAGINEV